MRFRQHLDLDASSALSRSALIAAAMALGLLVAPPLATAQARAQNPAQPPAQTQAGDKNITAQVQKQPLIQLPSLNPLVERVLPAVVSGS